jgi:hypothetical protein
VNKQLDDAITRVRTLPDEQQREAAQILLEFLDLQDSDMQLTPEQIVEIERRLSDDEPYTTSEEVRDLYVRLTK